jgi:very-short-patch-repair endonuclease
MACSDRPSRKAWDLAAAQHGVVARAQLVDLGLSRSAIEHRLRTGRLHPVMPGVYAVGRPELTRHGRWMAAVLCCGQRAVLSHVSAGALWGFAVEGGPLVDVSVRSRAGRRPRGIRLHRRVALHSAAETMRERIPVTAVVQTLVDLAVQLPPPRLERAVNEADRLDLIDPENLREALGAYAGQPGVRRLRTLLDQRTFRMTDSELERRFLEIVDSLGLERPLTRDFVNGFRVDFQWPALGLVVETDGLRYHRTPAQQTRDRRRDQAHTAAGLAQLRFTHEQVRHEPNHVRRMLGALVRRLERDRRA